MTFHALTLWRVSAKSATKKLSPHSLTQPLNHFTHFYDQQCGESLVGKGLIVPITFENYTKTSENQMISQTGEIRNNNFLLAIIVQSFKIRDKKCTFIIILSFIMPGIRYTYLERPRSSDAALQVREIQVGNNLAATLKERADYKFGI